MRSIQARPSKTFSTADAAIVTRATGIAMVDMGIPSGPDAAPAVIVRGVPGITETTDTATADVAIPFDLDVEGDDPDVRGATHVRAGAQSPAPLDG